MLVLFRLITVDSGQSIDCATVQSACSKDTVCSPLMVTYLTSCVLAFAGTSCRSACLDSYKRLLENPIGTQFYQCDCGTTSGIAIACKNYKEGFLKTCFGGVEPTPPDVLTTDGLITVDSSQSIDCATVQSACSKDTVCSPLMVTYLTSCVLAFAGTSCRSACLDSYKRLLENPIGTQFYQCDCGTTSGIAIACKNYKEGFLKTCFGGVEPTPPDVLTTDGLITVDSSQSIDCATVQSACSKDTVCSPLMATYLSSCALAFAGTACMSACLDSYKRLLENPIGTQFYQCDCGTRSGIAILCTNYKEGLLVKTCFGGVEPTPPDVLTTDGLITVDSSQSIDCATVQSACSKDTVCSPLMATYLSSCVLAFAGTACMSACLDSYKRLLENPIGNQFYQCDCGTTSGLAILCARYKEGLLKTCFGGVEPTPPNVLTTDGPSPVTRVASCATVKSSCDEDTSCSVLHGQYEVACRSAKGNCSEVCRKALYDLVRHPIAREWYSCNCNSDVQCQSSRQNLSEAYSACYSNGSIFPLPTVYPPGTCESIMEQCSSTEYATCGSSFDVLYHACNYSYSSVAQPTSGCLPTCVTGLRSLLQNDNSLARLILTCNCANTTSVVCEGVLAYRALFSLCGISAPGTTTTPVALTPDSKTLKPTEPTTEGVTTGCPPENLDRNVLRKTRKIPVGTKLTYKCKKGYVLVGEAVRICQSSGQYSAELPRCVPAPIKCERQKARNPLIEKSSPKVPEKRKTVPVGTTLSYSCKKGYSLVGNVSRVCQSNKQFSIEQPHCVGKFCNALYMTCSSNLKFSTPMKAKLSNSLI